MTDKSHGVIWRMMHIPLSHKVIIANGVAVTLAAVIGAIFGILHVREYPGDPHYDLIALFAAAGFAISLVLNGLVMKVVLAPLDRLQAALENVRQGKREEPLTAGLLSDEQFDSIITSFNEILITLEHNTEQLHHLSQKILQAQEDERQHIARELHDETAQVLTSLLLYLKLFDKSENVEEAQRIQNLRQLTVHALEEVRRVALELRPKILDDWGLGAALGWRVDELNKNGGARFTLKVADGHDRLPKPLELVFYRVGQEALTNVARHAHAQHASVVLKQEDDQLTLTIQDDGIGFDQAMVLARRQNGFGLLGMRERLALVGGRLEIESRQGMGTRLTACARLKLAVSNGVPDEKDPGAHS